MITITGLEIIVLVALFSIIYLFRPIKERHLEIFDCQSNNERVKWNRLYKFIIINLISAIIYLIIT